jgi:cyanophycin synthetase
MWAAALAWLQGIKLGTIRRGLAGFTNDIANNPGRYNYVDGLPHRLMIDYAHNADSASTVIDYIEKLDIKGSKILLSSKLGNRHREDFSRIAPRLSEVFDEIVVTPSARRVKNNPEYASEDPEATMLAFAEKALLEQGQEANALHTTKNLESAVIWALAKAGPEDFVLVLGDLGDVLPLIRQHSAGKE